MTRQIVERFKIRSVSDRLRPVGNRPGYGESRRSDAKADGCAWGWLRHPNAAAALGTPRPTRTK